MSEAQIRLPANDATSFPPESVPEAGHDASFGGETDGSAELGGHTLLGRPATAQGRRSLFRR